MFLFQDLSVTASFWNPHFEADTGFINSQLHAENSLVTVHPLFYQFQRPLPAHYRTV